MIDRRSRSYGETTSSAGDAGPGRPRVHVLRTGHGAAPSPRPVRHLWRGGHPLRRRSQHDARSVASYNGPLYQVKRQSDGKTLDIGCPPPHGCGGYANAAAQDRFCANTLCVINRIYDQSGKGNHLYQAPPGPISRPGQGRLRHTAHRRHGTDHHPRPQGVRRFHHAGHGISQQQCHRHRHQRRT